MGNCFLIFGVTVTTLVAMIVGLYLNQDLPEGLPYDQQFGARFVGANLDISRFLVGFYRLVFKNSNSEQSDWPQTCMICPASCSMSFSFTESW